MSTEQEIKEKMLNAVCDEIQNASSDEYQKAATACASIHEAEVKELGEDVTEMLNLFQYSIHTIGALNDKLNGIGHTGFETAKVELQQHLDKFKQKNNL